MADRGPPTPHPPPVIPPVVPPVPPVQPPAPPAQPAVPPAQPVPAMSYATISMHVQMVLTLVYNSYSQCTQSV